MQSSGEGSKQQPLPLQPLQHPPTGLVALPTQPLPSQSQPHPQNTLRLDDDELMSGDEQFEDAYDDVGSQPPLGRPLPLAPPQQLVGSNTHQIQLMKASFFSKMDDVQPDLSKTPFLPLTSSTLPSRLRDHTPSSHNASVRQTPFPYFTPSSTPYQGAGSRSDTRHFSAQGSAAHSLLIMPQEQPKLQTDPFSSYHKHQTLPFTPRRATTTSSLLAQAAVLLSKQDLRTLVPAKDSTSAGHQRCLCDHGLFLGRSFRVGWGPNWTLVHSGAQISPSSSSEFIGGGEQGSMFARHFPQQLPVVKASHPIRVVVEHLDFNTVSKDWDYVSNNAILCRNINYFYVNYNNNCHNKFLDVICCITISWSSQKIYDMG